MRILRKYYCHMILFLISVIILCQSPFSPYANKIAEIDAGVFVYGAKQLINGKLLYKEIFDHKGPLLYLINVLGLILSRGDLIGIWLVELVSLSFAAIFIFETACLVSDISVSLVSSVYSLLLLAVLEPGGTQFYSLPFISLSLYLFIKSFVRQDVLTITQIFIISSSFSLTFLLLPNLVAMWVGFGSIFTIDLIINRRYKYLITSGGVVFLSSLLAFLPFFLYGYKKNILQDAFLCFWSFNRSYADVSLMALAKGIFYTIKNIDNAFIPLILYVAYIFYGKEKIFNKKMHLSIITSLFLTVTVGCGLSGRDSPHYAIIIIPLLGLITSLLLTEIGNYVTLSKVGLLLIAVAFSWRFVEFQLLYSYTAHQKNEQLHNIVNEIKTHSGRNDGISVVGNDSQLYYLSGRRSISRFHYTSPIMTTKIFGEMFIREYLNDINTGKPQLIIIKKNDYHETPKFLKNILKSNYHSIDINDKSVDIYEINVSSL